MTACNMAGFMGDNPDQLIGCLGLEDGAHMNEHVLPIEQDIGHAIAAFSLCNSPCTRLQRHLSLYEPIDSKYFKPDMLTWCRTLPSFKACVW